MKSQFPLALTVWLCLWLASCAAPTTTNPAPTKTANETIVVSAAADLTFAFQEIGGLFGQETGVKVVFNFGSTGLLAQQIEQGAPVDLFAAANVAFVEDLEKRGRILPDTKALYAQGRITIWTPEDSPFQFTRLEDLNRPDIKYVAIANPDHAPYGIAAREAMQSAGVWDVLQPKLVLGDNAMTTLQYAQRGDVDVAIVPLSLSVEQKGRYVLIPNELHKPINQALAVIKETKHESAARAFAQFINGPQGRPIMRKYGFILPGETPLK
mgnify:CR=1 FL=1